MQKHLNAAVDVYKRASSYFESAGLPTHEAETYWNIAQLQDQLGEQIKASQNYQMAAETFKRATEKIPQLKDFYTEHSFYMQAWNQIEQARHHHSVESYEEARQCYEQAAKLHESTNSWNYLAPNYFAWAYMEEAEGLSRKEKSFC